MTATCRRGPVSVDSIHPGCVALTSNHSRDPRSGSRPHNSIRIARSTCSSSSPSWESVCTRRFVCISISEASSKMTKRSTSGCCLSQRSIGELASAGSWHRCGSYCPAPSMAMSDFGGWVISVRARTIWWSSPAVSIRAPCHLPLAGACDERADRGLGDVDHVQRGALLPDLDLVDGRRDCKSRHVSSRSSTTSGEHRSHRSSENGRLAVHVQRWRPFSRYPLWQSASGAMPRAMRSSYDGRSLESRVSVTHCSRSCPLAGRS